MQLAPPTASRSSWAGALCALTLPGSLTPAPAGSAGPHRWPRLALALVLALALALVLALVMALAPVLALARAPLQQTLMLHCPSLQSSPSPSRRRCPPMLGRRRRALPSPRPPRDCSSRPALSLVLRGPHVPHSPAPVRPALHLSLARRCGGSSPSCCSRAARTFHCGRRSCLQRRASRHKSSGDRSSPPWIPSNSKH